MGNEGAAKPGAWLRAAGAGEDCVEVAFVGGEIVMRRMGDKTAIVYTKEEWDSFLEGVRKGEFDFCLPT